MTFWELLGVVLSSAGLFASVLGGFLTYAARKNGEATRDHIRSMEERLTNILAQMDQRADERHREVAAIWERMDQRTERMDQRTERMDQRADERHQEVITVLERMDQRSHEED